MSDNLQSHPVVSREQWLQARRELLLHEKALTHQRDRVSAQRRALPWVRIDTLYPFEDADGRYNLADLFGDNSQLVIYHFMFGAGWQEGCKGCCYLADHFDGAILHLAHHDVSLVAVSHAPWQEFQAFRQRMGWRFRWVSSGQSRFNEDFGVSASPEQIARGEVSYNYEASREPFEEMPGLSVFYRDSAGEIFHTYSTYARGLDMLVGAYNFLDLTPKGRNEDPIMDWVRLHDQYEQSPRQPAHTCCQSE